MGIFSTEHAVKLLSNKFVVFMGDSVQRSAYKDLVVLMQQNRFIKDSELKAKGEMSFMGDTLVERSELTNGTKYKEVREFKTDYCLIRFYFITRIYNDYVESILQDFVEEGQPSPDVVMVNSCLWDISRYGPKGRMQYAENVEKFCNRLDQVVPAETCIIWKTALPLGEDARGGFLTNMDVNRSALLLDICLANFRAHAVVTRHLYDVIDMHYHFAVQTRRLAKDGVHWNQYAHRRMTNMFLTHVSLAWELGEPRCEALEKANASFKSHDVSLNTTEVLQHAYEPNNAIVRRNVRVTEEERYGGPIRNREEMWHRNFYNNFYAFEQENIPAQPPPAQANPYQFFPITHPNVQPFQPYDYRREQLDTRSRFPDPDWNTNQHVDNQYRIPWQPEPYGYQENYNEEAHRPPVGFGNHDYYPPEVYPNHFIARQQPQHRQQRKFRPYRRHALHHQF